MWNIEKSDDWFLYNPKKNSLELEESLGETMYYDQLLVLTAIASYNREEWLWKIRWKQAMLWENDMNIHLHCLAYETALKWWRRFLNWEISLSDLCSKVHRILLAQTQNIDTRIIPWEFRKNTVYIWWVTEDVNDAEFIYPSSSCILDWMKLIELKIIELLKNPNIDSKLIAWYIHYLIVKLHPFQDWNWRLSRIMAITFLECFWEKDARGFTFFSEMLTRDNINNVRYWDIFDTLEEKSLTESIKNRWLDKIYSPDSRNTFRWNADMTFDDYIDYLDIDTSASKFKDILIVVEKNKELVSVIVEAFLKAKPLSWDHILIWKFINKLFDACQIKINTWNSYTILINKEILNEVITVVDWKLKKSSVKNLLILINHLQKKLNKVWINIVVEESFFQKAREIWVLWTDIVSTQIRDRVWEII